MVMPEDPGRVISSFTVLPLPLGGVRTALVMSFLEWCWFWSTTPPDFGSVRRFEVFLSFNWGGLHEASSSDSPPCPPFISEAAKKWLPMYIWRSGVTSSISSSSSSSSRLSLSPGLGKAEGSCLFRDPIGSLDTALLWLLVDAMEWRILNWEDLPFLTFSKGLTRSIWRTLIKSRRSSSGQSPSHVPKNDQMHEKYLEMKRPIFNFLPV